MPQGMPTPCLWRQTNQGEREEREKTSHSCERQEAAFIVFRVISCLREPLGRGALCARWFSFQRR